MSITNQPWRRVVTPGLVDGYGDRRPRLFVTIDWVSDRNKQWELSITGVVGPNRHGNARGGVGQCRAELDHTAPGDGWTIEMIERLHEIWKRWHLNGMRAGSPAQEAFLQDHPYDRGRDGNHYDWARRVLAEAGLHPDPNFDHPRKVRYVPRVQGNPAEVVQVPHPVPYEYGSAWLHEDVPDDVLEWLYDLPCSLPHPWGDEDRFIDTSIPREVS